MEFILIYALGGLLYGLMEILWRGWTHWTMLLCGGFCFTVMYLLSMASLPALAKILLSAGTITVVEFLAGCLVNLRLGWGVWDYSGLPYNILGQVCPQFLLLWLALSVPGLALCQMLRRFFTSFL